MSKENEVFALPVRMDYDNLYKTLLHLYFWEALEIFLPVLYEAADRTEAPDFLEQELQKVTFDLEGGANRTDSLVRIKLKNGSNKLILCHIEVAGEGGGDIPTRMYRYKQMIYLKYGEEPIGIAVLTAPRPHREKNSYNWELFGVRVIYEYINVDVMKLEDDIFLAKDSRIGLVFYAAKCANLSGDDEGEKFRYLRLLSNLWAERGWAREDKRRILLAIEYLIKLKNEIYAEKILAHIKSLKMNEEDKEMYVSIFEKVYTAKGEEKGRNEGRAEGRNEERTEIARKLLKRNRPTDEIIEDTALTREEVENLRASL